MPLTQSPSPEIFKEDLGVRFCWNLNDFFEGRMNELILEVNIIND